MIYELVGYDTDSKQIVHREFTTSKKIAELFSQIPKIVFPNMNHGIVFYTKTAIKGGHPLRIRYRDYVDEKMNRLRRKK